MTDPEAETVHKKRRLQRACDFCRRKKIRCDGVVTSGNEPNKCSNCKLYNSACTYNQAAQKRISSAKGTCAESLEDRVERMDSLLNNLVGDTLKAAPNNSPPSSTNPPSASSSSHSSPPAKPISPSHIAPLSLVSIPPADDSDGEDFMTLTDNFQKLDVNTDAWSRFFGKSSSAQLVQTAIELKNGIQLNPKEIEEFEDANVCNWIAPDQHDVFNRVRPEFKTKPYWEENLSQTIVPPAYIFPEEDLLKDLFEIYFTKPNVLLPLLHRPTFEKLFQAEVHRKHQMFGAVVLLVCAIASRFSSDPRVLLDSENSRRSSGWKYFSQVQATTRSLLAPPTIYDLQYYTLYSNYLFGTSAPQTCWAVIGMGIRMAQDVGAHRRKKMTDPTIDDELWKRAFWSLVVLDRDASLDLGRPCAIQDDDIDVDFPVDCDDEYWDHPDPEKRFKQPPGKPSKISFFISVLKLNRIVGTCLRTLYSPVKNKLRNTNENWEQNLVTELDSALNSWVDSVPAHLRWDPHREHEVFFNQSVSLYVMYYNLQILIHKPFIPSPRNTSPVTFPSLAICTNAARSVSHIVDIQRQRGFFWGQGFVALHSFAAAIVLLLNLWGRKRTHINLNPVKEMLDVHNCMQVLKDMEETCHFAGRLWDILYQLASVGDLPLPEPNPPQGFLKRRRDSDVPITISERMFVKNSSKVNGEPPLSKSFDAGPYPPSTNLANTALPSPPTNYNPVWTFSPDTRTQSSTSLPVHSEDLARLPVRQESETVSSWGSDRELHPLTQPFASPPPSTSGLDDMAFNWWTNTPGGLDSLDDWSSYLTGVSHRG